MRNFLLILILIVVYKSAVSNIWEYPFLHYDKKSGLPSNTVYYTCTDKNGILWIGTDAGLSKFDGNQLITYTTEDGLPSNEIFEIFCDYKNRIWITSMGNEISYYFNGKIYNKSNDLLISKISIPDRICRIIEDSDSNLLVISFPFSVNTINKNNQITTVDLSENYGQCFKSQVIKDGIYYVTDRGSLRYNKYNYSYTFKAKKPCIRINDIKIINDSLYYLSNFEKQNKLVINKKSINSSNYNCGINILTIFDYNNLIWQISNQGLNVYDKNLHLKEILLKNQAVSNVNIDQYKNIWISTLSSGLYKLNSLYSFIYKPLDEGISNSLHSILVNDKYIFTGNNTGRLSILNRNNPTEFETIDLKENSSVSYRILKLMIENDELIIVSDVNTIRMKLNNHLFVSLTKSLHKAHKNIFKHKNSYILLTNVGVSIFNEKFIQQKEIFINDRFYSFCEYKNQKIFGSENALYYEDEKLKKYQLNQPFNYKIMDLVAVDSLLMAATTEKGVFIIHDHKIIKNINLKTGLNSNNCSKIIPYHGSIFIATNNGISRYNLKNDTYYKIMESDGLASNNVQDLTLYEDTLYAATDNGLSVIPIANLPNKSPFSFFLSPVISQKDTLWDNVTDVNTRSDKFIQLTLNAVSLGVKGAVRYYYRICERDSNFKITLDPSLEINIQEPGVYTFEAYSMDVNDDKSITAIMRIHVVPYWWQTLLFKISCVLAALSVLIIAARILIIRVRKKEQERLALNDRIQKLELDAWKSNINPHFLFNSINTMQSLYSSNQFEMANQFIANFSRVLRKTIDHSDKLMNTISEEIAYLDNYLALEKIKKGNKLFYSLQTTEPEILQYLIPSLLLQPIIENSVKHGIQHSKKGTINVVFSLQNDHIICTVSDNGLGLPENFTINPNSKGLKLVKDKIRIVENVTQKVITFTMANHYSVDGKRNGTITTFVMPVFESRFNIAFTN